MKVDSKGQPVAEGTFGLYSGISAKVIRTFVDPTKDDPDTQEAIADGCYIIDMGESGTALCAPGDFTATYDGVHVPANDGKQVEEGDTILLEPGYAPSKFEGKPVTVRSLYPIGTLSGSYCLSIKESKGDAKDGYWAIGWGQIAKVVKKASGQADDDTPQRTEDDLIDLSTLKVNDFIEFFDSEIDGGPEDRLLYGTVDRCGGSYVSVKLDAESAKCHGTEAGTRWGVTSKKVTRVGWPAKAIGGLFAGDIVETRSTYPGRWHVVQRDESEIFLLKPEDDVAISTRDAQDRRSKPRPDGNMRFSTDNISRLIERSERQVNEDGLEDDPQVDDQQEDGEGNISMAPTKDKSVGKVDIVREGSQIILPSGMPLRLAVKELQRQAEQEEMDVAIMEIIPGFPLDAAHAFVKALEKKYGWVNAMPTPGFFGPQPPVMIGVVVDPDGRSVQIPWGQIGIPGITGNLTTGIQFVDNKPNFCIGGTVKQKDKATVNEIALLTKDYLRDHSIYKGKAIKVKFPSDPKKFSPLDHQPKFIPTTDVRPEELIFSKGVEKQIRVNIWTPIQSLAAVKEARVPLKRGVLLFGRYGVGKTLLAAVTARMAVQSGITFMDLVDSNQLPQAVEFGRMLGGMVVIFAEDIDRCDENGERTDAFNNILNTVDGLTSKTDEVMIVYTTNHIEKISKAMLRQGRIDKVIHIKEPDADAAVRLVRLYARHLLPASEDLTQVGHLLGDGSFIPAAIREVVEQSKLAAIERGDVHTITADDILVTVEATREHMDLLKETPKDDRSDLERAADAFGKRVAGTLVDALDADGFENVRDVLEEELGKSSRRKVA